MPLGRLVWPCIAASLSCPLTLSAAAQPIPDGSLGTQALSADGLNFAIRGGSQSGENLFHSFSDFSVMQGGSVSFGAAPGVERIFSRVTGSSPSQIDGLIQGNTDLFLLNPNGILFGPSGQLRLGGSFLGATAQHLEFADGLRFGVDSPGLGQAAAGNAAPLLSAKIPTGLTLGESRPAGAIRVVGTGHGIGRSGPEQPLLRGDRNRQLTVAPGRSLILVGGGIELEGGGAIAPNGNIEFWSLTAGTLQLAQQPGQWRVQLPEQVLFLDLAADRATATADLEQRWGDILLDQRSLVETSGLQGGDITIRGDRVSVLDSSLVLVQTLGDASETRVDVQAQEALRVEGFDLEQLSGSLISGQTLGSEAGAAVEVRSPRLWVQDGGAISTTSFGTGAAGALIVDARAVTIGTTQAEGLPFLNFVGSFAFRDGDAGDVRLKTEQLQLQQGGFITSTNFGAGQGGDVWVEASDAVEIRGVFPTAPDIQSGIRTLTFNRGDAGNVSVVAPRIIVEGGGNIASSSVTALSSLGVPLAGAGEGSSGNVTVTASDGVEVRGGNPVLDVGSSIGTASLGMGDAGSTQVSTSELMVLEGGQVMSSTSAGGNAGSLEIQARRIEVRGTDSRTQRPSQIISSAAARSEAIQRTFGLPQLPSGDTGILSLQAEQIQLSEGGVVSVQHQGLGNAGELSIRARQLRASDGTISAATASGEGGNIEIVLDEALVLTQNSRISSEAGGNGGGGNIAVTAPLLVVRDSAIAANAFRGKGGNIQISTRGLLLFQSPITASSALGLDGEVTITTPDISPTGDSAALPGTFVAVDEQLVVGCSESEANQFVASGRGGLAPSPGQILSSLPLWRERNSAPAADARPSPLVVSTSPSPTTQHPSPPTNLAQREAVGMHRSANGSVLLVGAGTVARATQDCLSSGVALAAG